MAPAYDNVAAGVFTTEDPITLAYTPVGTLRGLVAFLIRQSSSADPEAAPPTYGGVEMTRVATAADTVGEPGRVIAWLLGASVPTGTQSFSLDISGTAGTKRVVLVGLTASNDLVSAVSDILEGEQANPQIALDSGADTALRLAALFGGNNNPSDYTDVAGQTVVDSYDFTNQQAIVVRQTTPSSGSATLGWTAVTESCAMVALAIKEQAATGGGSDYIVMPGAATDLITSPDDAAFDITGDLDLRIQVELTNAVTAVHQNLITKGNPGAVGGAYVLRVNANAAQLRLDWRNASGVATGVTSDALQGGTLVTASRRWYRVTLDVDNGATGYTVTFYFSTDAADTLPGSVSWSQHSQIVISGATTAISAGTSAVGLGNRADTPAQAMAGKLYYAEIRNGINGTIVGNPDFRDADQKTGPGVFTDSQSKVWTLQGNTAWSGESTGGTAVEIPWRPFDFVEYFHRGSESIDFIIEFPPFDFVMDGALGTTTTGTGGTTIPWRPFDFVFDADRWTVDVEVVIGPPPPPPPLPVITTEDILSAGALSILAGLELLDNNDQLLIDISDDLHTGVVARNMNATIHGTARLRISRAVNWHNQRLRPYVILTELTTGISERFDLGIYLPETPSRRTGELPMSFDVEAYDKLVLLNSPHGIAFTAAAGAGVVATVEALLDAKDLVHSLDPDSQATVPSARSWPLDPANTTLQIINDLLTSISYRPLYVDRNGIFRSEPYRPPDQRAPVWHYDATSPRTIVGEQIIEELDLFEIPNWWVFVRDDPAQVAPVEGNGIYTVINQADGATSINGRGRVVTKVVRLDAADQASLVAQGDQIVQRDRQPYVTLTFRAVPNPRHWHADSVTVTSSELGVSDVFGEQSWSLPLDGGDMSHEVRRSVKI